jgi:hypothetical protein
MAANSATMRVDCKTLEVIRHLAAQLDKKMNTIVEEAVEQYRRKLFFQKANEDYAKLRRDKNAWAQLKKERKLWDATLQDGLDGK